MEIKEIVKYKILWKMNLINEFLLVIGVDISFLKNFIIFKIRRIVGKGNIYYFYER